MSNVEPYNLMRNCTLRNIIATCATILSLTMGGNSASAQTVYKCYYTGDNTALANGVTEAKTNGSMCKNGSTDRILFSGSKNNVTAISGGTPTISSSVLKNIELYVVTKDDDGNEQLEQIDYIDRNNTTTGTSPNGYIGCVNDNEGIVRYATGTTTSRRFGVNLNTQAVTELYIRPNYKLAEELQGKTVMVRMNFANRSVTGTTTKVVDVYLDMIGGEFDNIMYFEDDSPTNLGDAIFMPCPGDDPVEMKIIGNESPYGTDESYLGNTYSVKYVWKSVADGYSNGNPVSKVGYVTDFNENNLSYSDETITSKTTSYYRSYRPAAVIYRNGVNTGCEVELTNGLQDYEIFLYQPLEAYNSFTNNISGATLSESSAEGSASVSTFYACYGDNVTYKPSFRQQDYDGTMLDLVYGNVYWALYRLNDDGSVAETLYDFHDLSEDDSYTIGNLEKTTSFKLVAEYYDDDDITPGALHRNGDLDSHPCPTEKTFTIEVRQISATTELTFPEEKVCDESDATIKATVSNLPEGDKASDYAYRWYYSDDDETYVDLNTTDWVRSDVEGSGWSDPTATVETTMKDVVYPQGSATKFIKFFLANTYKVNGETYYCEMRTDGSFPVYPLPVLEKNDDIVACQDQPIAFQAKVNDDTATPNDDETYGMSYYIYKDTVNYTSASDIVVPIYGTMDTPGTEKAESENYNVNRRGTFPSRFIWWGIEKAHPSDGTSQYKLYTIVKNEETTCVSHPVEHIINVLPLPEVASVTPDPTSYCLNGDDSDLKVTAKLNETYTSYDYSTAGVSTPSVEYHWNWYYPTTSIAAGAPIDSATTTTEVLSGKFDLHRETTYAGNVEFRVYATDSQNCGYQLNFDGTIKTGDNGEYLLPSLDPATNVLKINPKPDFTIELPADDEYICANSGKVEIELKSNDSRKLKFELTPKTGTTVTTNSPIEVNGNSSSLFIVNFDESAVKGDQKFEFDYTVTDVDNSEQTCDSTAEISFVVYERPQLNSFSAPVKVCYNQPQTFTLNFAGNITIPTEGLTYFITTDQYGASPVTNVTATTAVSGTTNSTSTWRIEKEFSANYQGGGSVTLYAWVRDVRTGCLSDAVPFTVVIIPQPTVESLTFSTDSYCRYDDASALTVTANMNWSYANFNYDNYGLTKPTVTYHWSWTNGKQANIGTSDITDNNVLTNAFTGLTSEVSTNDGSKKYPLFTVYVTDTDGCGYVLDNTGATTSSHVSETDGSITVYALPYPYIESNVTACANDKTVTVNVGSNDDRALAITFSPSEDYSATLSNVTTNLAVAANSNNHEFTATIDCDKVADITTFTYNVHAAGYYPTCGMDTVLTFTVYPIPSLQFSPASDSRYVCQGSGIALSVTPSIKDNKAEGAAANYSYVWTVDGEQQSTSKSFTWTAPEDATVGNHTVACAVTYRFTDGHSCTKTESIDVFVNPRPVITFGSDVTICEGETTTLTGSVTNGYDNNHLNNYTNSFTPTVSPELTGSDAGNFTWTFTANPTKTTTYSFTAKNTVTGCESKEAATATVTVDRKAHFKVTGLSQTEVCQGNYDIEVDIECQNRDEFEQVNWNGLTAFGFTVKSATDTKIVLNGDLKATSSTESATVKIGASIFNAKTAAGCEVVFDNDLSITVRPVPDAPAIQYVSSTNNKEWVCKGQNQTITYKVASPIQRHQYQWFIGETEPTADATPSATTNASNASFTVSTSSLTKDTYVWVRDVDTRYSATNCPSAFASYLLKVEPVPAPSYSIDEICENEQGVINITSPLADASNSYTYYFYSKNNTDTPLQSGSETSYTTETLTKTTSYYIAVSNVATECKSDVLEVSVTVNKRPVGHTTVAYQDSEGSSTITDPFGNSINRTSFCEGEQGKAIITLNPTMQTTGTAFTSTLVAVSSGNVSDWSKDSEGQWSCANTHVWNEGCTLTFTVKDSETGCESEEFSESVTVKPGLPTPAIQINSEAEAVCYDVNTAVKLSLASAYNYESTTVAFAYYMYDTATGTLLAGPLASTDGSYSSTTTALGIKSSVYFTAVAYDKASGCLSPVSNAVNIKVNPLPEPTISVTASVLCPDEETTMTVNETYEKYQWLDGDTQGKTTQSVTVKLTSSATFRVQVTDNNGCVSEPVSTTITVHPRPAFHMEADPATVCQNSTDDVIIKIIPENADKVDFANNYTFTTLTGDGTVTSRTNASGETEYVVTGHTWTEASETFQATVNSTEEYNSCLSEEKTVTVYVISALPKPEALAQSPQDGTLTNDIHVCYGSTDKLTAYVTNTTAYPTTGGVTYTYHWYSDADGKNELTGSPYTIDQSAGTITFVPTENLTLYVKAVRETDPQCSSELSNVLKVTIEALPSAPAVLDPNPQYVCQPEMKDEYVQLLINNPATDNTYHWYNAATDEEIGSTKGTTPLSIIAPTATTVYYARTESKYGCYSSEKSATVEVTVGTNPVIKAGVSPKSEICSGTAINMTVGVVGDDTDGITYEYTVTSSNLLSTLAGKGTVDASGNLTTQQLHVTDTETLTFTFKAVFAGKCYSDNEVSYQVVVHGNPTVDRLAASPNPMCEGEDITIEVDNIASHDGSTTLKAVRIVDTNGNVIISNTNVATGTYASFDITADVIESGIVRDMLPLSLEVEDENCTLTQKIDLVMNDIPEFEIESKNGGLEKDGFVNFCRNDTIILGLTEALPETDSQGNALTYTYQWSKDNATLPGAVNAQYQINGATPTATGTYTLTVTSYRNGATACTYSRSLSLIVNELPSAVIDGENINGYFCTDGDLDLFGNEGMIKYEWTVDSNPEFKLTKTQGDADFDNKLVKSLSELNVTTDGSIVVHLIVTDELGCRSIDNTANVFTAVPPVISAINGTEACEEKAFVITVDQDRSDYDIALYESDGVTEVQGSTYDSGNHSITTSTDLAEGEYVIIVTDNETNCTTDTLITLKRYDIEPTFDLQPDADNNYYCYNGTVSFDITLEENNGHEDFFEKIEDVNIELVYTYNDATVRTDAAVTITENKLHVEFSPNDPDYNFTPSTTPYIVKANLTYKFKSDVQGYLSCDNTGEQELQIVEIPVIVSEPEMPVCLDEPIKFIVSTDNITATAGTEKYIFFVNGVQVVNADGDYTSNEFSTDDHEEISLQEGDLITAQVVMDEKGNICTSEPLKVTFKSDFKPEIQDVNLTDELCLGSDITFNLVSVMPERVDDPATFELKKIKSYDLFIIDSKGESQYGTTVDISSAPAITTPAKVVYDGEDTSIQIYAKVTDEEDCEYETEKVTVKINQFKITDIVVTNASGNVMNTDDLCADIDYTYRAIIADGDGNVITPGDNYDFTFTMDGVEWSDHSTGKFLVDSVTNSHAVTDGYISMVVNVTNLTTGCKTDATLNLYKPYSEDFKFHAKPTPNEKLVEDYKTVSDDEADQRKYEICYDNAFTFTVDGNDVTVVYDDKQVARYVNGSLSETIDESTLAASSITPSYADEKSQFAFNITPSEGFHTVQFIVSDGTCEVESDVWQFRKYEDVKIDAIDYLGSNVNVNNVVTLCQGYSVTFGPSTTEPNYTKKYNFYLDGELQGADDFSTDSLKFTGVEVGTYELKVVPDFGNADCSYIVTIEVKESPAPDVTIGNLEAVVDPKAGYNWTFSFCENQDLDLSFLGAESYHAYDFKVDGTASDAFISESSASQSIHLSSRQTGNGFSTYTFNVDFIVANCIETGVVTINVYNNPEAEFINNTPKTLIISGEEVTVDVTPGFSNYKFIVDGETLQDGASSTLPGANNVINESCTIEVVVTNEFDCDTTLTAKISVLDNIEPKTITTSSDYYCSEDEGVRITVVDPQNGITYQLVNTGATIKYEGTGDVYWEPVRLTDPTHANPEEFKVIAFYDQLPDQQFDMSNTVTVEEVKSPVDAVAPTFTASNCETVQTSGFTWTITGTDESNTYWLVDPNGVEFGPMTSATGSITIPVYDYLFANYGSTPNGDYKVIARTKRQYGENAGDFVCEKTLAGTLTIDIPTTEQYEVKMTPISGNICIDDLTGVDIYIESSDYSADFDHVYVLYQDGVEVARKTSTSDRGEIRFSNVTVNQSGNYVFSIVCLFNGCSSPMLNTQTLNVFAYPEQQTLTVDNDGYFCYDANGATITVGGQQKDYEYRLFRNGYDSWTSKDSDGNETTVSYKHIGDESGAPFTFEGIKESGTYTVKVFIPALDRVETSCVTVLETTIEINATPEPTQPDAHINKAEMETVGGTALTVCADEAVRITLLQPEKWDHPNFEVHYAVYDEEGNLVTETEVENISNSNRVVFDNFKPEEISLAAGVHKLTVVATQKRTLTDGTVLECVKEFEGLLQLYVKNRPSNGTESITIDTTPEGLADDPCYGIDLVVNNANTLVTDSVEYRLYIIDQLSGIESYITSIKPYDGDEARFKDIRNGDGYYHVVAYNGACSDDIPPVPVHVLNDKYAAVQTLDVEDFMCQGDAGVSVGLMDSEENVIYRLYFVKPADWDHEYTQAELIDLYPGVMISEYNKAEFDHQRITFTGINYQDGSTVSDLIDRDGYYYVICVKDEDNACPVASPVVNFQSLKLPKSFNLMENRFYCDGNGVQLYVEHSELDPNAVITYKLYQKDAAENLTYLGEVVSDGSDMLTFKNNGQDIYVLEGTYAAIALKEYSIDVNGQIKKHICTSALATEVEVKAAEPLDGLAFETETILTCNGESSTFTLPTSALKEGIVYHLTDEETSPETSTRESITYDGSGDVTFSSLANGVNVIWASYSSMDCLVEIGRVTLNHHPAIPQNYSGTVCGDENLEVQICDSRFLLDGLTYWLLDADGNVASQFTLNTETDACVTFTGLQPQTYTLYGAFGGIDGDCATEMGVIEAVNPDAKATLYVAGQSYESGATIEMCPGLFTMANIEVKNAVATKYLFYFKAEGTTEPDLVYEGSSNACSFTEYIKETSAASGTLSFAIETVCGEYELSDTYTIKIKGNGSSLNHLQATNDALYCEGTPFVQLYYDDAKVGEIYRLYKVSSDTIVDPGDNNTYDDELVDMQEIPRNVSTTGNYSNILYFNGWGYFDGQTETETKDYASAGCYYVETTDSQGCVYQSDLVCVQVAEPPIAKTDSAFYVYQDPDTGVLDLTTKDNDYGYVGGVIALPNPIPGVTYYLVCDGAVMTYDDEAGLNHEITKVAQEGDEYVIFGPIKEYLDEYPNTVVVCDGVIYSGEGVYQIKAITDCESLSNTVTFIGEQLVAYDVEIYLNKNEMSRITDLIPNYDFTSHVSYKSNRKYIGWSSKIDRIYRPKIVTGSDGYYENDTYETESINSEDDPLYFRDGYTNVEGTYKEEKSKITYTGKSNSSNVWFHIVDDPSTKISGSYGFINVDYTASDSSVVSMSTPTGYFFYMKQPSFYGVEKIKYYVENYQMPGRRSNIATITILCGNESVNDSSSVFLIPNAFSPNGDGLNDVFKIIIPDKYEDNSESKLQVFNRWGTLVYRSTGLKYGEDGNWWDGTSSTSNMVTLGSKLPSGTYYYVFTITFIDKVHAIKSERKMHGFIELRR